MNAPLMIVIHRSMMWLFCRIAVWMQKSEMTRKRPHIKDSQQLQGYASEHNFAVLMANHNGGTGGWKTCGKNRAWDSEGKLSVASENDASSLVILAGKVNGKVLNI